MFARPFQYSPNSLVVRLGNPPVTKYGNLLLYIQDLVIQKLSEPVDASEIRHKRTKQKRMKTTPSHENVPVDLDDFPSVYTQDLKIENGIPCTVFATPYDDLSTIDNDTIGHTVYPWDLQDGHPKHWAAHRNFASAGNHPVRTNNNWNDIDESDDKGCEKPITRVSHEKSTQLSASDDSKSTDSRSRQTNDIGKSERTRWRFYLSLVIVGSIIVALLIGLLLALLLTRYERVDTNFSPTLPSPTESLAIVPSLPPASAPGDTMFSREPSPSTTQTPISTTSPSTASPIVHPRETAAPTGFVDYGPETADTGLPTAMEPTAKPSEHPNPALTSSPQNLPTQHPTKSPTVFPTESPIMAPIQVQSPTPVPLTLTSAQENFIHILQNSASPEYLRPFTGSTDISSFSQQWQALEWLTRDPNYFSYRDDRKIQRYALAVFGFGLESLPDAATWLNYNIHECDWYTTASSGSSCASNSNGQGALLRRLQLDGLGLVGVLPVELGLLSNTLTQIYLQNNVLEGKLPTVWGQDFQRLERLQLTSGRLEGTLPPEWGAMTSLGVLGLGRNRLTGSLPAEWATIGSMLSLNTLGLERNELTGSIPTMWGNGGMPSLSRLSLDHNQLTGQVPDELWLTNDWEVVNMAGNLLTGTISDSTCGILTLAELVADCNSDDIVCHCCTSCM